VVVNLAAPPRYGKSARANPPHVAIAADFEQAVGEDHPPEHEDKCLQYQTNVSPPSSPRKVSRFNTHAEVWVEDGMVLMKFPGEVDVEHLFHRGRYRMALRRSMDADQQDLRVEILRGPS
jgi:hypothetical protein